MGIYFQENGFLISPDMYQKDTAEHLLIRFQAGVDKEKVRNGIDIDELIELALFRLRHYNSVVPCRENSTAITKLQEAQFWLEHRKRDREKRGITGTKEK